MQFEDTLLGVMGVEQAVQQCGQISYLALFALRQRSANRVDRSFD